MKLKLENGREIDILAVSAYHEILRCVAVLAMLNNEELVWVRSRLSDNKGFDAETNVFDALRSLCDHNMENNNG